MRFSSGIFILTLCLASQLIGQTGGSAFVGRWDFDVQTKSGVGANWLSVTPKAGKWDIWFQPTGGHVHPVTEYKMEGEHLVLQVSPDTKWDLEARNGKLTGTMQSASGSMPLEGVPAPDLKRPNPKAWLKPELLFNGRDLSGWEPIGDPSKSHWIVKDGLLVNQEHGANLKSTREFDDFKLHFEVNCPDKANSGFYLRGRYEVQLEYEPAGSEPMNRQMGAIYGRLGPDSELPRKPGAWETFDVMLIGRRVTIVRDGVVIINNREIEGITGGALNADEGKPGPFYIQGDHTGGLMFRNISVAVPRL